MTTTSSIVDCSLRVNNLIHRFDAYFGVVLLSGSFTDSFIKKSTGECAWPGFAFLVFEHAPEYNDHIVLGDFTFDVFEDNNQPELLTLIDVQWKF